MSTSTLTRAERRTAKRSAPDYVNSIFATLCSANQTLYMARAFNSRGALEPAGTTSYTVADGQVAVPVGASVRAGAQPVVEVLVNGAQVARVRADEVVDVVVAAEVPSGGLPLRELALDLAGAGDFGQTRQLDGGTSSVEAFSTSFDRPGTYFVAARVTSQDPSDRGTSVGRVHNIARARVIVD